MPYLLAIDIAYDNPNPHAWVLDEAHVYETYDEAAAAAEREEASFVADYGHPSGMGRMVIEDARAVLA